ncbi:MAG: Hsp20 family protein [Pseudomonadota bacterium]
MSRITTFPSTLFVGFEDLERALEQATARASGDGFPPYNIERIAPDDIGQTTPNDDVEPSGARIRITLAVAGFSDSEIEITEAERKLTVRGRRTEDDSGRDYLHRGIAGRQFLRTFVLADGIEVANASLENGLLMIDLRQRHPQRAERNIPITNG